MKVLNEPTATRSAMQAIALLAVVLGSAMLYACAMQMPTSSSDGGGMANASTLEESKKKMSQEPRTEVAVPAGKEIATVAGGCFWCTEAVFTDLKGVEKVESGYSGGHVANPSYEQVCGGDTGHAEAIQITFDPKVISLHDLLTVFFTVHDPTTLNRQGNDVGTQYRSAVFTHSDAQKATAEQVIREITDSKIWPGKIVTEVTPFTNFYKAENYHQEYFKLHGNQPYCQLIIAPKVAKFRAHFREKLKQ